MHFAKNAIYLFFALFISTTTIAQSTWTSLTDSPMSGVERMFHFEIDGIVYMGGGRDVDNVNNTELWAFDPGKDTWEQLNDFPGARRNAVGFSVGESGYMGLGYDGYISLGDFWKYSPATDTWEQLADFPGGARSHSLGISGSEKGYLIAGGESVAAEYFNDLWEFNAASESWTLLSNIPSGLRWRAYGWKIGETIYVGGGGQFPNLAITDFWSYDLTADTWEAKPICPTLKTSGGYYFQLKNKGYFVEGATQINNGIGEYGQSTFVFDPQTDLWDFEANFIGEGRVLGFSTAVNDIAVVGSGRDYLNEIVYNDVYLFTPDSTTAVREPVDLGWKYYPNPVQEQLIIKGSQSTNEKVNIRLTNIYGQVIKTSQWQEDSTAAEKIVLPVAELAAGVYQLEIIIGAARQSQLILKM